MYINKNADIVISELNKNQFESYVVGGCVRDCILGYETEDIDITTNAKPSEIISIFEKKYKTIKTGIKYGTVTVIVNNLPIEITTYRSESGYNDGRHPINIVYESNIENDLPRRDFTINAMAYNKKNGLIDLYGGLEDLKNKTIRCVGNSEKRFEEDKLRMIRAIRFAGKLGFEIEKTTFDSIKKLSNKITDVSMERINTEFTKILLHKKPSLSIYLLYHSNILKYISKPIYDMYGYNHNNATDLFSYTMQVMDSADCNIISRLSALFCNVGKMQSYKFTKNNLKDFSYSKVSSIVAKEELKKLRYPNKIINTVTKIIENHIIDDINITDKEIRVLISKIGIENIYYLLNLYKSESIFNITYNYDILEKKFKKILSEKRNELCIDGNYLMSIGYKGKIIGEILEYIFDIVTDDPNMNKKEILTKNIKEKFR